MTLYLIQIIILHFIKINKHESYLEIFRNCWNGESRLYGCLIGVDEEGLRDCYGYLNISPLLKEQG